DLVCTVHARENVKKTNNPCAASLKERFGDGSLLRWPLIHTDVAFLDSPEITDSEPTLINSWDP
ncbi:unnamed protein product, partial [Musa acuminata var. zebrina]